MVSFPGILETHAHVNSFIRITIKIHLNGYISKAYKLGHRADAQQTNEKDIEMSYELKYAARSIAWALSPLVLVLALLSPVLAVEEHYVSGEYGVSGYDPVAYFTVGAPTKGSSRYTAKHDGVTYRFSSQDNLEAFQKDPAAYLPAYGGFCAFGTAMGRKFSGDPNAWKIVDGTLYLNLNKNVQEQWVANVPGFVKGADNNWPIIRSVADADLEANAPVGITLGAQ